MPAITADRRLLPIDIVVYITLMFDPVKQIKTLIEKTGIPGATLHRSINRLLKTDWAYVADIQGRHRARIFVPWMPLPLERTIAQQLHELQFHAPFRGEWLLKCILDHIVADHNVHDNFRPPWAVTGHGSNRMEFDRRHVEHRLAIEFHGSQHFQKGDKFNTTDEELEAQIYRDNFKAAICIRNNIHLIEFTAADLSYAKVRQKLEKRIPLIPVRERGPIYTTIEHMCHSYKNHIAGLNSTERPAG